MTENIVLVPPIEVVHEPRKPVVNYLTVAQNLALEVALQPLEQAGFHLFMVGSCLERATYRDVDIRCWLHDEADQVLVANRVRRRVLDAAVSEWLSARTGLPIDFQFQTPAEFREHQGKRNGAGILLFCEHEADKRDLATQEMGSAPERRDVGDASE